MSLLDASRSKIIRNLVLAILALQVVMLIGTLGYHALGEGRFSWIDCYYMTFITISTIGFTEAVDVSHYEYGKLFTVFIGITGIGVMGYVLSTFTAFMLESDLNVEWRRSRMRSKISRMRDHYIVCGVGRVGSNVVHELIQTNRECVMIDENMQHIEICLEKNPDTSWLHGDATDNDVLIAAGVKNAKGLFAVAQDDSQNLVISLSAKQLNPNLRVVARCHEVKNVEKTLRAGADEIVSPDFSGAQRLVSAMVRPQVLSFLDELHKSAENLRMEEVAVPEGLQGKPLSSINPHGSEYAVLAVGNNGKNWKFNPQATYALNAGDILMVMTTPQGRSSLEKKLQSTD
jgi:voltage-gated potassium channel